VKYSKVVSKPSPSVKDAIVPSALYVRAWVASWSGVKWVTSGKVTVVGWPSELSV
jgi:hypothetical protein